MVATQKAKNIFRAVAVTALIVVVLGVPVPALAIDDVGSGVVTPEPRAYIDAKKIESTDQVITSNAQRPVIFGYTEQNVGIELFTDGEPIGTSHADETGYWRFSPLKNLEPGVHSISVQLTDTSGVSSDLIPLATVRIPREEIQPTYVIGIPGVPINQINYLTVTLLILTISGLSLAAYLFAKKHTKQELHS